MIWGKQVIVDRSVNALHLKQASDVGRLEAAQHVSRIPTLFFCFESRLARIGYEELLAHKAHMFVV